MIFVALLLGGTGTRTGLDVPKQFIEIKGKMLFEYALETFDKIDSIDEILLVTTKDGEKVLNEKLDKTKYKHSLKWVLGGKTRQESVFNALNYFKKNDNSKDYILIHDACRPLVTPNIINEVISNLNEFDAVTPVLMQRDSLCIATNDNLIKENVKRENFRNLQTPQGFKFDIIYKCHKLAIESDEKEFTDDTSLCIKNGYKVKLTDGDQFNFKVTTFDDLFILNKILG